MLFRSEISQCLCVYSVCVCVQYVSAQAHMKYMEIENPLPLLCVMRFVTSVIIL